MSLIFRFVEFKFPSFMTNRVTSLVGKDCNRWVMDYGEGGGVMG